MTKNRRTVRDNRNSDDDSESDEHGNGNSNGAGSNSAEEDIIAPVPKRP